MALSENNKWLTAIDMIDQLRRSDSPLIQRMMAVKAHYNADVYVPTFDIPGEEQEHHSPSPLLIADAVDKNAQRAASVVPVVQCPEPMSGRNGADKAIHKAKGIRGGWRKSGLIEMGFPRLYRHYFAYGTGSMIVEPNLEVGCPIFQIRDPLQTYGEPKAPEDFSAPKYVGFVYAKSRDWILRSYPEARSVLEKHVRSTVAGDMWDILEFWDGEEILVGILGPRTPYLVSRDVSFMEWRKDTRSLNMLLRRWENRAGMVPGYAPRRVTLDRIESSVMKLTGHVNELGRLRTIEMIAAEKAIDPTIIAFGDGETPVMINTPNQRLADGRDGIVNLIDGARGVQVVRLDPSIVGRQVADQIERSYMQSAGLDPLMVGEARGASLRTGRALRTMSEYSLDPHIQEAQRIVARAVEVVNEGYIATLQGYYGNKMISLYTGNPADRKAVEIKGKDYDTVHNTVFYPLPGADLNETNVALGQAMQTQQMSAKTARVINPLVADPEFEEQQIFVEAMERALAQGFLAMSQDPNSGATLVDLAQAVQSFKTHGDITRAITDMDTSARQRQANQQPTPEQMVGGIEPGNPGAAAQPQALPAQFQESTDGQRLRRILTNLNARTSGPNTAPTPAARAGG